MNFDLDREAILSAFPARRERFDCAVDRALVRVHDEAAVERQRTRQICVRRALGWGLAAALVLAGALGVADGIHRGVFDFLFSGEDALPEAEELIRRDVAAMRIGGTELAVSEAVFDGATLRFVMSVRRPEIGWPVEREELWEKKGEFWNGLMQDGVTVMDGFDWFLLNGREQTMTGGSGGAHAPGTENGEALIYFELNLSETEISAGDIVVSLPVAKEADAQDRRILMDIPVRRVPLDCIRNLMPADAYPMGMGELTVLSARLSPIMVYLSLRLDFPDEVPEDDAYRYISAWQSFALVDAEGREVCSWTDAMGSGIPTGETDTARHLWVSCRAAPVERCPERLFLAPVGYYAPEGEWGADMSMAVELTKEAQP